MHLCKLSGDTIAAKTTAMLQDFQSTELRWMVSAIRCPLMVIAGKKSIYNTDRDTDSNYFVDFVPPKLLPM